jgi:hypothetical protein
VLCGSALSRARTSSVSVVNQVNAWPELPLDEWQATYDTVHLWTQIVGKTRLALAPMQNHWWQAALYVTSRGLGTSPMPYDDRTLEVEFDFIEHQLIAQTSDGTVQTLPLAPQAVADFYREYVAMLRSMGIEVKLRPVPNEMEEAIPFAEDRTHASYDGNAVQRCWHALVQVDRVMKEFRGRFIGKCSPVHFWWGGFDIACTRFSGRRAPTNHGGVPYCPDYVMLEAYSHECISAGWWPGGLGIDAPAFYSYVYPEPDGFSEVAIRPATARYHPVLRDWILPYDAVRIAPDPDRELLDFLQSTYEAAATASRWDRAALER